MSKTIITAATIILFFSPVGAVKLTFSQTFPNLSGIWRGEYNSSQHGKVTSTQSSGGSGTSQRSRALEFVFPEAIPGLGFNENNHKSTGPKIVPCELKIYYVGNQSHVDNLKTSSEGSLIFFDYARLCLNLLQRKQHPAPSGNLDLQLGQAGLSRHDQTSGPGYKAGISHDISADISLSRDEFKDILTFKLVASIQTTIKKENETINHTVNLEICFPLKRDSSQPEIWTDEEIGHLLSAADNYPLTQVQTTVPPGNGPLARVATIILGNSREGYLRLFNYTAKLYNLSTPKAFDIDMNDLIHYGYYSGVSGVYANLRLCPLAFSFNPLFLASSYVHEYTHHLQHNNEPTPEKTEREIEAHCIQKTWINSHPELPGPLQKGKTQQIARLDAVFAELFNQPLQCQNGVLPRNWVRSEIAALTVGRRGGHYSENRQPEQTAPPFTSDRYPGQQPASTGNQGWQTVVE